MAKTNEVIETAVNATEEVLNDVSTQVEPTETFNWKGAGIILGVGTLVVVGGVAIYKKWKASKKTTEEEKPEAEVAEVEVVTEENSVAEA